MFSVACAQVNSRVGDFSGNRRRIVLQARRALHMGADCVVTPQGALTGYPSLDLFKRRDVAERAWEELKVLAQELYAEGLPPTFVGTMLFDEGRCLNAMCLLRDGAVELAATKQHTTRSGFFDESRVVSSQRYHPVVEIGRRKVMCVIGQDAMALSAQDVEQAEMVLVTEAQPYWEGMPERREAQYGAIAKRIGKPLAFVNAVGGNDAVVFDGSSCGYDAQGQTLMRAPSFEETTMLFEPEGQRALGARETDAMRELYSALVVATRDYVIKNGFKSVMLGLSGGVDSALVATIARDAIGAENVHCIMMPTRFTADESLNDAKELVERQGLHYRIKPIEGMFRGFLGELSADFEGCDWDITEENLQARIRGVLLMAFSNKFGHLVLTTGNKSEAAVGYSTLYGDSVGAYAPICDVLKTKVWELCRWRNRQAEGVLIPENIIDRAPSAELRENQTDQQSLPDYALLDEIIHRYVHLGQGAEQMIGAGLDATTVRRVLGLIHRSEYKRRQCPTGPKVTPVSFGVDWKYPMTACYSV